MKNRTLHSDSRSFDCSHTLYVVRQSEIVGEMESVGRFATISLVIVVSFSSNFVRFPHGVSDLANLFLEPVIIDRDLRNELR